MSLDFYLVDEEEHAVKHYCSYCDHTHECMTRTELFHRNITHNLNEMFEQAGAYRILWHGDDLVAGEVLRTLEPILMDMMVREAHFRQWDAANGWGRYEHALEFLKAVVTACKEHPSARLRCSR